VGSLWRSRRVWAPFVAAALCLAAAGWVGPAVSWLLIIASFGLCLDGVTLMWSRAGSLTDHRQ
jgi:hypothetical protein